MRILLGFILLAVLPVQASEYVLGDNCTIGDISFTVAHVASDLIELNSPDITLNIGPAKLQSICLESKMNVVGLRRILWVGKLL